MQTDPLPIIDDEENISLPPDDVHTPPSHIEPNQEMVTFLDGDTIDESVSKVIQSYDDITMPTARSKTQMKLIVKLASLSKQVMYFFWEKSPQKLLCQLLLMCQPVINRSARWTAYVTPM